MSARSLVLYDPMNSLCHTISLILLLLTYGITSPYAAFVIGIGINSQLYTLHFSFCRYYFLQFGSSDGDNSRNDSSVEEEISNPNPKPNRGRKRESVVDYNTLHIESICEMVRHNLHTIIWPGLILTSILFSAYLFDVAMDTDEGYMGGAIAILVISLVTIPLSMFRFYKNALKQQMELKSRVKSSIDMGRVSSMRIESNAEEKSTDAIKNPIIGAAVAGRGHV
jgi:hypothetical protein